MFRIVSEGIVYGDYYLLGRLNTGGMAEVFLGKRLGDAVGSRVLAVKRILTQFSDDSQIVQMFEDEARIARRLHHPNICEVYDEGVHNKQLYLVMEFIHGKDLRVMSQRARKAGERISYAVTAFVSAAIADALEYAHTLKSPTGEPEPIVHRDVSPQNILVSYDGVPKLIDFGIAKAKNRVVETRVGLVKGKYGYMSPEQATGGALDGRSDVFSLGVVLYELATGLQPFRAASDVSTLRKVARAAAMPASTVNAALPARLASIIDTCLQRDPAKRYQSAALLAADLREFIRQDGRPITTESLARTMREMFRDDYKRERARVEHYQALPTPPAQTAMANVATAFDESRTTVSPVLAPETMLAAGYGAEEEQTSADDPQDDFDDEGMIDLIGDGEAGSLETTKADESPDPFAVTMPTSSKTSGIDNASFAHVQPSLDDEPTSAEPPRSEDVAEDNPWATARTRAFTPPASVSRPSAAPAAAARPFVHIPEGPTVVAGPMPRPPAAVADIAAPSGFGNELTKPDLGRESAQLSDILGALGPLATIVSPSPIERPEKAQTRVAPMPQAAPKKRRKGTGPAPLVDDEPTDARDVEEDIEERDEPTHNDIAADALPRDTEDADLVGDDEPEDTRNERAPDAPAPLSAAETASAFDDDDGYIPLFTRSETITLLIAAMMGFLIMTASYLYALNVQLPDPDPIVEQQIGGR
jgi:serine/threonine protein kinase